MTEDLTMFEELLMAFIFMIVCVFGLLIMNIGIWGIEDATFEYRLLYFITSGLVGFSGIALVIVFHPERIFMK